MGGKRRRDYLTCRQCGGRTVYYSRCDTFGCHACDLWSERVHDASACADGKCDAGFETTPERPSLYKGLVEDFAGKKEWRQ